MVGFAVIRTDFVWSEGHEVSVALGDEVKKEMLG